MIGFEDEHVRGADAFEHQPGRVAEVGGETNVAARRPQEKPDGILRIVGNLKSFNHQVVQFKMVAGLEQPPVNLRFQIRRVFRITGRGIFFAGQFGFERPDGGVLGVAIAIDGNLKFIGEAEHAGDVVAVFVGDENGGQLFRGAAEAGQALADLARGKPGIHQHARLGGLDIGAIAGGTAAQDGEFYGHNFKLVPRQPAGKCF